MHIHIGNEQGMHVFSVKTTDNTNNTDDTGNKDNTVTNQRQG